MYFKPQPDFCTAQVSLAVGLFWAAVFFLNLDVELKLLLGYIAFAKSFSIPCLMVVHRHFIILCCLCRYISMAAVGAICQHFAEVHVIFSWMTGITTRAYNLCAIEIKSY